MNVGFHVNGIVFHRLMRLFACIVQMPLSRIWYKGTMLMPIGLCKRAAA